MTIREAALETLDADPAIHQAFAKTSNGDRSILRLLLDSENGVANTNTGSPNYALFARFVQHGWMTEERSAINDQVPNLPEAFVELTLTENGRRAIPVILPILFAEKRT